MKLAIVLALTLASLSAARAQGTDEEESEAPRHQEERTDAEEHTVVTRASTEDEFEGEAVFIEGDFVAAEPGTTAWSADALAEVAGNQGDALRGVARLAGVARPGLGQRAPGLSIWGTEATSSQIFIDDIPMPRLLHLGGYRSIVPSSTLHSVTLIPGAPSPRYGRALGGVVDAKSARIEDGPMRASAYVDALDVGMLVEAPAGKDTSLRMAARQSLIAQSFALLAPSSAEALVPLPDTWDHQVQLDHRLSPTERLRVSWLGSVDFVERSVPGALETRPVRESLSDLFQRVGLSLTSERNSVKRKLVAYAGLDRYRADAIALDVETSDRRRGRMLGLLLSESRQVRPGLRLQLGVDAQFEASRHRREGALSLPGREGDMRVFGVGPGPRVSADTWNVTRAQLGLFASLEARIGRWLLEPGLRVEPGSYDGDRVLPVRATEPAVGYSELDLAVDPRLSLRFAATRMLTLFARAAQVQQSPMSGDLSPVFGAPRLEHSRARQLLVGVEWLWQGGARAEFMALASSIDRLSARADTPTPPLAGVLTSRGEGRVWGNQLRVEVPLSSSTQFQFGYTFMRSRRRSQKDAAWRAFDFDQPHRLRSALQWQGGRWKAGASLEVVSGLPRTPVAGATFDTTRQQFDPVFGAHNTERLPLYAQLSARISYRNSSARVWLEVINLTNRSNVEERYYTSDFQQRRSIYGLPILPFLGAEVYL